MSWGLIPIIVRPLVSNVIVARNGSPTSSTACIAASSSFSAYIVSIHATSAPPRRSPSACSAKASKASVRVRSPSGSSTSPVGPMEPATTTVRFASSATRRVIPAADSLISTTRSPRPCSASRYRFAPNVLVRMMSAPAATMPWWTDTTFPGSSRFHRSPHAPPSSPRSTGSCPWHVSEEPAAFGEKRFKWMHRCHRSVTTLQMTPWFRRCDAGASDSRGARSTVLRVRHGWSWIGAIDPGREHRCLSQVIVAHPLIHCFASDAQRWRLHHWTTSGPRGFG